MVFPAWYCYTNDAFKFFTNQKLAIRIFKKGYQEKDGQHIMLRWFYSSKWNFISIQRRNKLNRVKCKNFEFSFLPIYG